jgi:hypothetical protein
MWTDEDGDTVDAHPVPYSEADLKTMMQGYPEGHPRAGHTKAQFDKKARRKKGKAQRQARKKNR